MTHVAITGASGGIGLALVEEYVKAGAAVTMVARRQAEMEKLAARVGGRTQIFAVDLCDEAKSCDWLAPAAARFGPIDILINNAGVQIIGPTQEFEPPELETLIRLNLTVPMRLTLSVLPEMLHRGSGTIVDVSSVVAMALVPGMWGYNAVKSGIAAASESLRAELHGTGVHVLTVYPGPVDTSMGQAGFDAYPPWVRSLLMEGNPVELSRRIRSAIELKQHRIIYPLPYTVTHFFPGLTRWFLGRYAPAPRFRKTAPRPHGES